MRERVSGSQTPKRALIVSDEMAYVKLCVLSSFMFRSTEFSDQDPQSRIMVWKDGEAEYRDQARRPSIRVARFTP